MSEHDDELERPLQAVVADDDSPELAAAEGHVLAPELDDEPSDPFSEWPEADGADFVEDPAPDGAPVQHLAGELDVPDGYTVLEGTPSGHRRTVAVVVSRFNGELTNRMLATAIDALEEAGVTQDSVRRVPPTTPMDRLSFCGVGPVAGASACGALSVSVNVRFRSTGAVPVPGAGTPPWARWSRSGRIPGADMQSFAEP